MTKRVFGQYPAPGWQVGDSDERDKAVIRLNGGAIQNINLNIGYGQTSSSCSVTIVEEEDGVFQEPNIGQPIRIAIANRSGGDPDLYDWADTLYSLSYIGMVSAINNNSGTSGRVKTIELVDTKEVLKNIPVILNRISSKSQDALDPVPNIVYAYEDGKRNEKGLKISAIKDAVDGKKFSYYGHTYYINISSMFEDRSVDVISSDSFFGSIDNTSTLNFKDRYDDGLKYLDALGSEFGQGFLMGDAKRDDSWANASYYDTNSSASNKKKICSYDYRIQGESASLLDIIDEAMTKNGCDWYVRAYEVGSDSLVTGPLSNSVYIQVVPILRNSFNQFTESEFNRFVGTLDGVESSKIFGKELANQVSNKAFFGAKWEAMQKADVKDEFDQFWGYKKDLTNLGAQDRSVVDAYGNEVKAISGIYTNPTFDTSSITYVNDDGESFDDFYEFDLSDRFTKYCFYLLGNLYYSKNTFTLLLINFYLFVENYRKALEKPEMSAERGVRTLFEFNNGLEITDGGLVFGGEHFIIDGSLSSLYLNLNTTGYIFPAIPNEAKVYIPKNGIPYDDYDYVLDYGIVKLNGEVVAKQDLFTGNDFSKPRNPGEETTVTNITIGEYYKDGFGNVKTNSKYTLLHDGIYDVYFMIRSFVRGYHSDSNKERQPVAMIVDEYGFRVAILDGQIADVASIYEEVSAIPIYKWAKILDMQAIMPSVINSDSSFDTLKSLYRDVYGSNGKTLLQQYKKITQEATKDYEALDSLYNVVTSYLDENLGKKYIKKIDDNDRWIPVDEVWDGYEGYTIVNPFVRGKFMNKSNGKMPCLYRIKHADYATFNKNEEGLLFVNSYDQNNEPTDEINAYGRATAEYFSVGRKDGSASDERYLLVSLENIPQRTKKTTYTTDEDYYNLDISVGIDDLNDVLEATESEKSFSAFLDSITKGGHLFHILGDNKSILGYSRPTLRVIPTSFYIPTVHSYARYGPWILDGNNVSNNRSKYGITKIEIEDDLNPWQFRSYGDIQNYIVEQNKNTLMTEYRMNRGQVVVEDIPRYNIGRKIGNFSNISSITVSYGTNGVSTTYTLTAFGAGERVKEQRDKQEFLGRIRNLEMKMPRLKIKDTVE